jgi:cell division protein DivIC
VDVLRRTNVTEIRSDYVASKEVYNKVKKKRRRGLYRRLVVYFLFLAFSIGGMTSIINSQSQKIDQSQAKKRHLEKQLTNANKKKAALNKEVKLLHDDTYIGKIARGDYYMSKDGEIIFASPDSAGD